MTMVHQMIELAEGIQNVYTEMTLTYCVLAVHHCASHHIICTVTMYATIDGRTLIDIAASVHTNADIIPQQLAAHDLTSCSTHSRYWKDHLS